MPASLTTLHVIITSTATGDPSVFLVERQPGVVEFPSLSIEPGHPEEGLEIVEQIEACTGLTVSLRGYVDPPPGTQIHPPGSRFLLARLVSGQPRVQGEHAGWEWRPAASLLSLQFVPKLMVDELRSYMNG